MIAVSERGLRELCEGSDPVARSSYYKLFLDLYFPLNLTL